MNENSPDSPRSTARRGLSQPKHAARACWKDPIGGSSSRKQPSSGKCRLKRQELRPRCPRFLPDSPFRSQCRGRIASAPGGELMAPDREFRLPRIARPIRIWSSTALLFTPLAVFGSPAHGADEWTTMNKDYSAQRYVDLDEITKENAGSLREVCEIELNQPVVFSSGLLMVGGTLYVLTNRQTVAFDAATCVLRWRHVLDFKGPPVGAGGRGLGYLDGEVFRGAADGRVMAFDANTGKVLWDVQAANPERQEMFPSAPIAWQGKVFIGLAYSDSGLKGRLMALDADTGKELWRFNTTLGYSAGGGFWSSYSLDPATGEVFAGVANPHPDFNREISPA